MVCPSYRVRLCDLFSALVGIFMATSGFRFTELGCEDETCCPWRWGANPLVNNEILGRWEAIFLSAVQLRMFIQSFSQRFFFHLFSVFHMKSKTFVQTFIGPVEDCVLVFCRIDGDFETCIYSFSWWENWNHTYFCGVQQLWHCNDLAVSARTKTLSSWSKVTYWLIDVHLNESKWNGSK